ncbi:MAG: DUF3990 domain-containing protein [Treponema sp.]|nr:DUF3990 domain-containing protein [Treponema sp.]
MTLYHGGTDIIQKPLIRPQVLGRDFGRGFYCTDIRDQAEKWARRQGRIRNQTAILNTYEFDIAQAQDSLNIKLFNDYSLEWLELVVKSRKLPDFAHGYDIIFGKIANDDVGETIQAVFDGLMPMDFALERLVFMTANNQYCFCTEKALDLIIYLGTEILE